jgi:starch phosphorylase
MMLELAWSSTSNNVLWANSGMNDSGYHCDQRLNESTDPIPSTHELTPMSHTANFFLFGLTAAQVAASRGWYNPRWHYDNEPETRAALDLIGSGHFNRAVTGIYTPLIDTLLTHGDHYMHLADLKSYLAADDRMRQVYASPDDWARMAILNIAGSGKFSSDRTIAEYANGIWRTPPCPVG